MAQFFDFSDAEMPDISETIAELTSAPNTETLGVTSTTCAIHPNEPYVIWYCYSFLADSP